MTIWLTDLGYQVMATDRVATALETAQNWQVDVLLSDIDLPDGDGLDLVQRLKRTHQFHALAISGCVVGPEERERSREAGFAAHLEKPINPDELLRSFEQIAA